MEILKRILNYLFWTIIALFCVLTYAYLLLGAFPEGKAWYDVLFLIIYRLVYMYVVPAFTLIIALIYILLDVFCLRKKLSNNFKSIFIRLVIIIAITIVLAGIHLFLEKGIDVI